MARPHPLSPSGPHPVSPPGPHPLGIADDCVQSYLEPWEQEVRRKLEAATAELFMTRPRAERGAVKVRVQTLRAVLRHLQGRGSGGEQGDSVVDQQREQIALLRLKLRDTKRKLSALAERHRVQRKIIKELRAPRRSLQQRHQGDAHSGSAFRSLRKHLAAPQDVLWRAWAESEGGRASAGEEPEELLTEEEEETLSELRQITESTARHLWAEPEEKMFGGEQEQEKGIGAESKSLVGRRHDVIDCFRKMFTFFTRGSAPCRLEE